MTMEELHETLKNHVARDDANFSLVSSDIEKIKDHIEVIRDNHLVHIQGDMASLKADMGWVMRIVGGIGTVIVAVIIWFLTKR